MPAIGTAAAPGAQDGVDLLALAALWGSLLLLIRLGLAEPVSAAMLACAATVVCATALSSAVLRPQ